MCRTPLVIFESLSTTTRTFPSSPIPTSTHTRTMHHLVHVDLTQLRHRCCVAQQQLHPKCIFVRRLERIDLHWCMSPRAPIHSLSAATKLNCVDNVWLTWFVTKLALWARQTTSDRGIEKNPSRTLTKNKVKLEYINEEQPSSLELAFGVELGLSHSF